MVNKNNNKISVTVRRTQVQIYFNPCPFPTIVKQQRHILLVVPGDLLALYDPRLDDEEDGDNVHEEHADKAEAPAPRQVVLPVHSNVKYQLDLESFKERVYSFYIWLICEEVGKVKNMHTKSVGI